MNLPFSFTEPFSRYAPTFYCPRLESLTEKGHCSRDQWVVPKKYQFFPQLLGEENRVTAQLPSGLEYSLYHEEDMELWRGSIEPEHVIPHFKGRIAERVLALGLSGFVDDILTDYVKHGYSESRGWVVKEKREPESRPYHRKVIRVKSPYALQHDRRTTFKLLRTVEESTTVDDSPITCAEIDGLARLYLQNSSAEEKGKYLLVAEVKTSSEGQPFVLEGEHRAPGNINERLFSPLRQLFPKHQLVYVLMGYGSLFFKEANPYPSLTSKAIRIVRPLQRLQVQPLFLPLPENIDCQKLAEQFYQQLLEFRKK